MIAHPEQSRVTVVKGRWVWVLGRETVFNGYDDRVYFCGEFEEGGDADEAVSGEEGPGVKPDDCGASFRLSLRGCGGLED